MPFSKRIKIRAKYNANLKQFTIKEKARIFMNDYGINQSRFNETLKMIEANKKMKAFERDVPIYRKIGLKFISLLPMLLALYFCFVILQLALLNIIMLGIMLIYLGKLQRMLLGFESRSNHRYKLKDLERFIAHENESYYHRHNLELVAEEEGKLIELQLPDDVEDAKAKRSEARKDKDAAGR